jgi:2-dehydropantoate 2-reductase
MNILVLGAGALGSLLGARLSRTEARVSLLTTNREHVKAIRESGLLVEELDGSVERFALDGYDDPSTLPRKADLTIVAVKSYDTERAVAGVKDICCDDSTLYLTLQNGIGNWERIAGIVGEGSVLAGTTAQGSTLVAPGRIRHGGNGPTFIGEIEGTPTERVKAVCEVFRKAGLKTELSDRMRLLIWEKLLINVGINAITALTGIRNGLVAEVAEARELSRGAVAEALLVARARGFDVSDNLLDRVVSVAKATAVNRSSMGQDVDRKKMTEIDAINGAVVMLADEAGIPAPVNRTLTQLVKTLEAGYLERTARRGLA